MNDLDGKLIAFQAFVALPGHDPDTVHLLMDFALAIGTNSTTRTITHFLRAIHWAGQARKTDDALPAAL